jgi:hypothetical protein
MTRWNMSNGKTEQLNHMVTDKYRDVLRVPKHLPLNAFWF